MTYTFEWNHPDIDARDTVAMEKKRKERAEGAIVAVEKSLEAAREMLKRGEIQGLVAIMVGLQWLRKRRGLLRVFEARTNCTLLYCGTLLCAGSKFRK